jgi:release factor glutamine methyltransferase
MLITIQETVNQLAQRLRSKSETAQLDAQVLVAHHLGHSRSWVLAHPEASLSRDQSESILQSAGRLEAGEPLPYVLGHWEFYGLDFILTPDVLIPRPETELLVEKAIRWLQLHPNKRRVADVGTGSGCIGIAIGKYIPDAHLFMTDISPAALEVARRNAERHGILDQTEWIQGDLLEGLAEPLDLICANLPYIPTQDLERLLVTNHEPRLALDGGKSGTQVISCLLEEARGRLIAGGMLLLEIEASQGEVIRELAVKEYPQSKVQILKDLSGKDRCVEIERPSRIVHLCTPQEWTEHDKLANFRDQSLSQNGFIHCSQPEQIIEVVNRYYQNYPEMTVLWIDPEMLGSEIRWEKSENAYYPHVYGPINMDAIEATTPLRPGQDGKYSTI